MDLRKYIGIPYVEKACGFDGVDCWQLVRLLYRHEFGEEIPDLDNYDVRSPSPDIVASLDGHGWRAVEEPTVGDVVLFDLSRYGAPDHIGIYVGNDRVLHIAMASMSVIQRIPHKLVWGVYSRVRH